VSSKIKARRIVIAAAAIIAAGIALTGPVHAEAGTPGGGGLATVNGYIWSN
jgi:hypothetical protein